MNTVIIGLFSIFYHECQFMYNVRCSIIIIIIIIIIEYLF